MSSNPLAAHNAVAGLVELYAALLGEQQAHLAAARAEIERLRAENQSLKKEAEK